MASNGDSLFDISTLLDKAIAHHQRGEKDEAFKLYQQVVGLSPENQDANRLIGILAKDFGDLKLALLQAQKCVSLYPNNIELKLNLANAYIDTESYKEAIETLEGAYKIDRRHVDVQLLMGDAYQELEDYESAINAYKRALKLDRSVPEVYNNYANALVASSDDEKILEKAVEYYQKAISLRPNYADAHYNMGKTHIMKNASRKAVECFKIALYHDNTFYKGHEGMASVHASNKNYEDALKSYEKAYSSAPNYNTKEKARLLMEMGNLHHEQKHYNAAIQFYDKSLQLNPHKPGVLRLLANTFNEKGMPELSRSTYHSIASHSEDNAAEMFMAYYQASMCFPIIYENTNAIAEWRNQISQELDLLLKEALEEPKPPGKDKIPNTNHFYLAYQGFNDYAINKKLSAVFSAIFAPETTELPSAVQKSPSEKITIGFVSRFFDNEHTIKRLTQRIIAQMSRDQFNIVVFSVGTSASPSPIALSLCTNKADQYFALSYQQGKVATQKIAEANLDVLFYADLGMEPFTYWLAHHRLAPVQCVTWGHPVTTGVETIDYYISSKLIEPNSILKVQEQNEMPADPHYSETLILLSSLQAPNPIETVLARRGELNLPKDRNLYVCPQSLYKFHPDFDTVIASILEQDPNGSFVFIVHNSADVTEQLKKRLMTRLPEALMDRVIALPRLQAEQFVNLLACTDVLLDTLYFGGGLTSYEALAQGTPIITWPGNTMKGRVTLGCYLKQFEPTDEIFSRVIAESIADYAAKAVKLGTNKAVNAAVREKILSKKDRLFDDASVIEELSLFFKQTVEKQRLAIITSRVYESKPVALPQEAEPV
ncbi:MAG: tetratricopeptide repeat protein [Cyanobacteria bacterium P01_H01_bin.74]